MFWHWESKTDLQHSSSPAAYIRFQYLNLWTPEQPETEINYNKLAKEYGLHGPENLIGDLQPPTSKRQPGDFTENLSRVATQNTIPSRYCLKTKILGCFNLQTLQIRAGGTNLSKLPKATSNLQAQWVKLLFQNPDRPCSYNILQRQQRELHMVLEDT